MATDGGNGDGAARDVQLDTLVLTYNAETDHLDIGGAFSSVDKGLDMLSRATRALEARWRLEQIAALQQQAADAEIARRVGLGRPRG